MAISISYPELKALDPCIEKRKAALKKFGGLKGWGDRQVTVADAQAVGVMIEDVVWVVSRLMSEGNNDANRRLYLWAADCAAHVLPIYERTQSSLAPRNAIVAARLFARGKIGNGARCAAAADAEKVVWTASKLDAQEAAVAAFWAAYWNSTRAYWSALQAVLASGQRTIAAERQWQYDRLAAWMSDEEPEDWPLPEAAAVEVD